MDHSKVTFFLTDKVITHLISQGRGPNSKIQLQLHVVITAQGVTEVLVDSQKGPCTEK